MEEQIICTPPDFSHAFLARDVLGCDWIWDPRRRLYVPAVRGGASGDVKLAYGTATSITITLNSLGSNAAREGTAVDNGTNLFLDALVEVLVTAGTVAADKRVLVYAYDSADGTNYSDNVTGSDAALTMRSPTNLRLIGVIETPTNSVAYRSAALSVARAFGGRLPPKWGIVVENRSGAGLAASGNSAQYRGVFETVAP